MTYARRTRYSGQDCFPDWVTPAGKRFWTMVAEAACRAEDRLRSGEAEDSEVYDLVLAMTGDEKAASDAYTRRIESRNRQRLKG